MDLSTEKQRPQKVEVVNNSANPTQVVVSNVMTREDGSIISYVSGGSLNSVTAFRPATSRNNVFLENILLLQGDGTFVPVPLCSFLTNLTASQLTNLLASYKTAYATLVSGVTAATLHYSKMDSVGATTSEVYNLKD